MVNEKPVTVRQAAERLNLSTMRVIALIRAGRIQAEKFGRDWAIDPVSLAIYVPGKVGRPVIHKRAARNRKPPPE